MTNRPPAHVQRCTEADIISSNPDHVRDVEKASANRMQVDGFCRRSMVASFSEGSTVLQTLIGFEVGGICKSAIKDRTDEHTP